MRNDVTKAAVVSRRQFITTMGATVVVAGLGVACQPVQQDATGGADDGENGQPQEGGTLVAAKTLDVLGLDPHLDVLTYPGQWVMPLIYMPLYNIDENLQPRAGVAESFELEDPTTYVFSLRQGLQFHSGKSLTAEDVKYTLDRFLDPDAGHFAAGWLSTIESVAIRNERTVEIHLNQPNWALPESLYWVYVMPSTVADEPKDWAKNNVDGTGPFKLKEWNPGSRLELERFDDFSEEGLPYLEAVSLPVVPDESSAISSLGSGSLDLLSLNDPNNFRIVQDFQSLETVRTVVSGPFMINFNTLQELMTEDVEFRRALALATDREEILQKVNAGLGQVTGIFSSTFDYAYVPPEELTYTRFDLEQATRSLQASEYPSDRTLKLVTITSDPVMRATGELVKTQWERLGIDVNLESLDSNAWTDTIVNPENASRWDITINSFSALPNAHLQAVNMARGLSGFYGPTPTEFVGMVDEAAKELDETKRSVLYKEIAKLVDDQVLQIFTYEPIQIDAHQPRVEGLIPYPDRTYREMERTWMRS